MSGVVHLHRKVAGSLNLGFLPTYLVFFLGGCILIPSGGSTRRNIHVVGEGDQCGGDEDVNYVIERKIR